MLGVGLNKITDLPYSAVEKLKQCDLIYFEYYTSVYNSTKEEIETFLNKEIIMANRELVENNSQLLENAKTKNVAFLVIGDVFAATTHIELYQQAKKQQILVEIIPNASILTAVGITGLELYKFGKTTSIPFPNYEITTPYDVAKDNQPLHTLFLLDLKPDENKFLSPNEALNILLKIEKTKNNNLFTKETKMLVCLRLATETQAIHYNTIENLLNLDYGPPPYCLILPGKLHFKEEELLEFW